MPFCHGCHRYSSCPTPALRAQEDDDFCACAFYIALSSDEASRRHHTRWYAEYEINEYLRNAEIRERYLLKGGRSGK